MTVIDYTPIEVFRSFHASTARNRSLFGGYGSGKSVAGCAEAIALGLEQPGSEILVTRKTAPSLRDTTEKVFVGMLPPDFLAQCETARAGGHYEHITFPTGSTYYFRGMDDWKKHRSLNLAYILWDEADEFTKEDYEGMNSRMRQTKPTKEARALGYTHIDRRGNILASNPQGHNWLWDWFVSPETAKSNTDYWTSSSLDNPHLPLDYVQDLLDMPDPWVRRYVLCSFDDFAGAVYPEWGWDTHVISPFRDPADSSKYLYDPMGWFVMGFDPGTSDGNAAVWCYYDRIHHRLVAVAEYNETGLAVSAHTTAWRRIEAAHKMRVRRRIADPKPINMRDRGSNVKLSDQYRRRGFSFQLGPNSVDDRTTALGELIHQGRFVCTSECMRLYEQLLNYRWEDLTPAQIERGKAAKPLKKNVDLVDSAQYAVSRYIPPTKEQPKPLSPEAQHSLDTHKAIRAQIQRRRKPARNHDLGGISV